MIEILYKVKILSKSNEYYAIYIYIYIFTDHTFQYFDFLIFK